MRGKIFAKAGLEGVYIVESEISDIDGINGKLHYRGIPVEILAEKSNFEETAFLILNGHLPTKQELIEFKNQIFKAKKINSKIISFLKNFNKNDEMMDILRTTISYMGCCDNDDNVSIKKSIELAGAFATIIASGYRIKNNLEPIEPLSSLSHAQNFYYMLKGEKPDDITSKIIDTALILHAEQGLNASTFTAMVISSSLSDLYSAITGAIGTLKGPLHGGANIKVIKMFEEIKHPDNVEEYLSNLIKNKQKIMGFGHRVYKTWDPRAKFFKKLIKENLKDHDNIYIKIAERIEKFMLEHFSHKKIYPNIDFYSGILYSLIGIPEELFTPIFAMARVIGWAAHVLEYRKNNRIFRPLSLYKGNFDVVYKNIEER